MRILIVSQWFDPEPTLKGLQFAAELRRRGHEVQVLTGFPNYPGGRIYDGYRIRPFQREILGGVRVLRVPLYPSHDDSRVKRILNYGSFAFFAALAVLLVRRPDVAYVYHPPATVGLPAAVARYLRRVPVVYDVQDLWPDTLAATGMVKQGPLIRAVGWTMRRVYRASDRVVVLSDGFKAALEQRGVEPDKVAVIRNWTDEATPYSADQSASRAAELGFAGRTTITFAGNLGPAQSLHTVLRAAARLEHLEGLRFLIIGDGIDLADLKREARRLNLGNVEFVPRVSPGKIGEYLELSDALLVHLKNDPLFEITIPSKTQAYLRAGKPLLVGVSGDAQRLVEDAKAGIPFTAEDDASLAEAVKTLLELPKERRADMGRAGRAYYERELAMSVGVSSFERVFEGAVASREFGNGNKAGA